jgi:hypothetical protein
MTEKYETKRQKALEDNSKYDTTTLSDLDITGSQGGGKTDSSSFIIKQYPYPVDQSIKRAMKVNLSHEDPRVGEKADE